MGEVDRRLKNWIKGFFKVVDEMGIEYTMDLIKAHLELKKDEELQAFFESYGGQYGG